MRADRFLRLWLLASAALIAALAVWAFAPLLVFVVLLTFGLGAAAAIMIAFSRALQTWRDARRK
jgi:hypothetical protein